MTIPRRQTGAAASTVRDWMRYAARRFSAAGLAFGHGTWNADEEAHWLLVHVLKVPFEDVPALSDRVLREAEVRAILRLLERRIRTRKPLAYLLHEAWLAGMRFYVDERVIVPRSFIAELLPDGLSPWLPRRGVRRALDLCTGSGCLAILAARAFPCARVDASDISTGALAVAERNIGDHRLRSRIGLLKSDLFAEIPSGRRYELILSNPPYVNARAMRRLPPEYRSEPRRALAGGSDGLDAVMRILRGAAQFLAPRGALVLEIGHNRAALERRLPEVPFTWLSTSAGDDMVLLLTREQLLAMDAQD
jgi:ribosomal protein L3 glutamine methyltransferase